MDVRYILGLVAAFSCTCVVLTVDLSLSCADKCDVYVDGVPKYREVPSSPTRVRVRSYGRLLAIKATQFGDPSTGYIEMLPEFDNVDPVPYITTPTWKCTIEEHPGWELPLFDETSWDHARVVTSYTGTKGQKRIWASNTGWDTYCRLWMPNEARCEARSDALKNSCGDDIQYQGECEARGCCFEDAGIPGVPKCYYVFNALPLDVHAPLISDAVPRVFGNYGLVKASAPVSAMVDDNAQVGAYIGGSLITCFRACVLSSCNSMYLHEGNGNCVMYREKDPLMLMSEADWAFYTSAPLV